MRTDDVVAEEEKEGVWVDIDQECPDGKVPLLDQEYCLEIHDVDGRLIGNVVFYSQRSIF